MCATVLVFGLTGVGKSSLVNLLAGNTIAKVGHGIASETVSAKEYMFYKDGVKYTVIDTAGIDNVEVVDRATSSVWDVTHMAATICSLLVVALSLVLKGITWVTRKVWRFATRNPVGSRPALMPADVLSDRWDSDFEAGSTRATADFAPIYVKQPMHLAILVHKGRVTEAFCAMYNDWVVSMPGVPTICVITHVDQQVSSRWSEDVREEFRKQGLERLERFVPVCTAEEGYIALRSDFLATRRRESAQAVWAAIEAHRDKGTITRS